MVSKEVVGVGIHPFNSVKPPGSRSTCLVRGALCSNVKVRTESIKKPIQRQSQLPISRNWPNNWGLVLIICFKTSSYTCAQKHIFPVFLSGISPRRSLGCKGQLDMSSKASKSTCGVGVRPGCGSPPMSWGVGS